MELRWGPHMESLCKSRQRTGPNLQSQRVREVRALWSKTITWLEIPRRIARWTRDKDLRRTKQKITTLSKLKKKPTWIQIEAAPPPSAALVLPWLGVRLLHQECLFKWAWLWVISRELSKQEGPLEPLRTSEWMYRPLFSNLVCKDLSKRIAHQLPFRVKCLRGQDLQSQSKKEAAFSMMHRPVRGPNRRIIKRESKVINLKVSILFYNRFF